MKMLFTVFRDIGIVHTCKKLSRTCSLLSNVFCIKDLTFVRNYARNIHPMKRTIDVLKIDLPLISKKNSFIYPEHADVVIIGGGHIGSAIAHALKTRTGEGLSVVVLEKDITFEQTQKKVSFGTLTQHFSLPENIYLSKYGLDFLRNAKEKVGNDCDLQYIPTGSLVLASEKYAEKLEENVNMLNEIGVKNKILSASDISNKFPWINTKDIKLGCMAVEAEGIFNSWALLNGLIKKSQELGAIYINADVTGFELEKQKDVLMEGVAPGTYERINRVIYKTKDNKEYSLKFAICVLAAGNNSRHIAEFAKIGTGKDILEVPLPVEKRECNVYSIEEKATETGLCTPMVIDTTGLWLMRNGLSDNLLCGHIPMMTDDTKGISEEDYFNNIIQPSLINRFPSSKTAEIKKYTKERFDCNTFDNNGILGMHPYHNNLLFACGYGRLGCQHAPGIGRAISELIIDSKYISIDLTRFNFDRFLTMESVVEFNIY